MTLVLVNPEYPAPSGVGQGGTATYLYALATALTRTGATVHLCVKEGIRPERTPEAVKIHWYRNEAARGVRKMVEKIHGDAISWERGWSRGVKSLVDKIHASTPVDIVEFSEYNGLAWAFTQPRPYLVSINFRTPRMVIDRFNHHVPTGLTQKWYRHEKSAVLNADSYRTASTALRDLVSTGFSIPADRIPVIRNPIDTSVYDTIGRQNMGKDTFDILFVGRLEGRKGAELMVSAVKPLLQLDPRIRITFAGEATLGEATGYRDAMERVLTGDERMRVWFPGPVSRSELPALYCRSDVFIIPSLFDNSPNTLLEAIAARLPVVGSDVGGINEIIRHEHNGLLFSPNSSEELLTAVRRVLENPSQAAAMASVAYHEIRKQFSPSIIAEQTRDYYESLRGTH